MNKEVKITSSEIKQAIDDLLKENEKYKEVLDKIKEYVKEWRESDGSGSYGTLELLELLEEIE